MERKHPAMGVSAPAILELLSVFLVVAESQVFADSVMGIVDFLTATAGLQTDFDADIISGQPLQAQTNDPSIAGVLPIEVCQKLDLQFFFCRCRAELVQNLILYGRL